jgi:1-deoxy-D-xylulose-5-phosphate synthase
VQESPTPGTGDPAGAVPRQGGAAGAAGATPVLDGISSPKDLQRLSYDELDQLAREIRDVVIDAVTTFGGHLGSNLGAVELTLALHRVFESPQDILLWDTGHLAYAHKLVTGRRDGFAQLRQPGGMSGYPSRAESEHDWVENSHASTILSYTHGMATAEALAHAADAGHAKRQVVAVIGDGSMTGGMAFEGLNNLGHSGSDCVIVLNDNGRSYAPTASRLGEGLRRLLPDTHAFALHKHGVHRGLATVHGQVERVIGAARHALREGTHEPPEFFETLGVHYTGPVDGHDIPSLERALQAAADTPGPVVVHVLTQKGRGYEPAENDPIKCLHDTSVAKPGSYTIEFSESLVRLGEANPKLVAITAAMADSTGLLPFAERFPDRFFDVGIAEQHAVAAAAGMAMNGLIPVVAVYSTFMTRAIDQVMYDVGLHGLPVIFCLDRAGITGDDGASHHGVLDMALMSKVPGLTMLAPSSLEELDVMLKEAVAIASGPQPGPVAIRWSKTLPPRVGPKEVGSGLRARRLREGDHVCIIAVGKAIEAANGAVDLLAREGILASLWDPRCIKPLDPTMLFDAARHPFVLTVEDGIREGGIGAAIADQLAEMSLSSASAPRVQVVGTPIAFLPHGNPDAILAELGLGPHGIAEQARMLVQSPNPSHLPTGIPSGLFDTAGAFS